MPNDKLPAGHPAEKSPPTLEEMLASFDPELHRHEFLDDEPVGKERFWEDGSDDQAAPARPAA